MLLIREELIQHAYFKNLVLGDEFLVICKNIRLQAVEPLEVLFNKGDPSKAAYIVLEGVIDVILTRQADPKLPKMYDTKGVVASMNTG